MGLKSKAVRKGFQNTLRKNLIQLGVNEKVSLVEGKERNQDVVHSSAPVEGVESLLAHGLGIALREGHDT